MAKQQKAKKRDSNSRGPRITRSSHKMDRPANRRIGGPRKTLTPGQNKVFTDYAAGNITDEEYQVKIRQMRRTFLKVGK